MFRLAALLVAPALVLFAEEAIDSALNARLREAGLKQSQVMGLAHELCDRIGPRLTASPQYLAAANWALARLKGWGVDAHLEPWDFGHPGWSLQHVSAHVLEPWQDPLTVEMVAWTPGTKGLLKGTVLRLVLPEQPTAEELAKALEGIRGQAKGAIVLVGPHKVIPANLKPSPLRHEEATLRDRLDPYREAPPRTWPQEPRRPGSLDPKEASARIDAFLVETKAALRVDDARMVNGQIRAFANRTFDISKAVPTVVMRSEDFGRIWRVTEGGTPVKLAFDLRATVHPELTQGLNVVGEIKGSERPEETVILTAHLDSWHTATGATDNGANACVMMEALRLLKELKVQPKRTIRVVLFDGEEQGLLGSLAYAKAHYGEPGALKPEADQLVAMFNQDGGAGQLRGVSILGPKAAGLALHDLLSPWRDLGVVGASWNRNRPTRLGGSDITVFTRLGLPGGGPVQDGLDYLQYTWHTTLDTYERLIPEDLSRNAVLWASLAAHLANRTERLPRWKESELPQVLSGSPESNPTAPADSKSPSR